ncbi:hypothetical protein ACFQL1_21190 [Halomicroarcula sp. GCM10025709]|uniref:hypothetical protein n=1 Tax=Haloarcula TaxID=2237 RepID=UPI0024C3D775|nr:hypothetical protein [Halomicroarcula sp. YJ-61-S]
MARDRAWVALAVAICCLALGGCLGVFGASGPPGERTVTPAPVPATATPTPVPPTGTPTPQPNGRALGGVWRGQWSEVEPERSAAAYRDLGPTCERPPALVVRLQIGALLTDTDRGIETTWRFLAPAAHRRFGSVETYAETFRTRYRPLVAAESVTRKPVQRNGSVAVQSIRAHGDGSTTTYRWRLERRLTPSEGRCWLTTGITELPAVDE